MLDAAAGFIYFFKSRVGAQTFPSENSSPLTYSCATHSSGFYFRRTLLISAWPHASLQSFGAFRRRVSHPSFHPSIQKSYLSPPTPAPAPQTKPSDSPAARGNASGSSRRCVFVLRGRSPGRAEGTGSAPSIPAILFPLTAYCTEILSFSSALPSSEFSLRLRVCELVVESY